MVFWCFFESWFSNCPCLLELSLQGVHWLLEVISLPVIEVIILHRAAATSSAWVPNEGTVGGSRCNLEKYLFESCAYMLAMFLDEMAAPVQDGRQFACCTPSACRCPNPASWHRPGHTSCDLRVFKLDKWISRSPCFLGPKGPKIQPIWF